VSKSSSEELEMIHIKKMARQLLSPPASLSSSWTRKVERGGQFPVPLQRWWKSYDQPGFHEQCTCMFL